MEQKCNNLTFKEKAEILQLYDKLTKLSQSNAAVQLKVTQSLLCKLLKSHEDIKKKCSLNENPNSKQNHCERDQDVKTAFKLGFTNVHQRYTRIDGPLLHRKAADLSAKLEKENFVATVGMVSSIGRKVKI